MSTRRQNHVDRRRKGSTNTADHIVKLIAEHRHARRLTQSAQRKMEALHDEHPALADSRPLISVPVKIAGRGEKIIQVRCPRDLGEHFYTSDCCASWRRLGCEKLVEAARPAHNRQRRQLGIHAAEQAFYERRDMKRRVFRQLQLHVPRSAKTAAALASYVYRVLEDDLLKPTQTKTSAEFEDACIDQRQAIYPMMAVMRRIAEMSPSR